jgi:hypothetical protein
MGRRTSMSRENLQTDTYTYDATGQLTGVEYSGIGSDVAQTAKSANNGKGNGNGKGSSGTGDSPVGSSIMGDSPINKQMTRGRVLLISSQATPNTKAGTP